MTVEIEGGGVATAPGATGGGLPEYSVGPLPQDAGVTEVPLFSISLSGVYDGSSAIVQLNVAGYVPGNPADKRLAGLWSIDVSRLNGVIVSLDGGAGEPLPELRIVTSEAGWNAIARVSANRMALEVLVESPVDAYWRAQAWIATPYQLTTTDDHVPPVVTFVLPAANEGLSVPVTTLEADEMLCVFYVSQSDTLPADPAWTAAPATVEAAAEGPQTFYAWARDMAGNVSARVQASTVVTIPADVDPPAITAFALPPTWDVGLIVTVAALTADEPGCAFYVSQADALPAEPVWTAAPATVEAAAEGLQTFYAWARDASGNVSPRASAQVNINTEVTYLDDSFDGADAWTNYNAAIHQLTGGSLVRTDVAAYRGVYRQGTTPIPAAAGCVTWDFTSAELAGGFLFFAVDYVDGDPPTGFQVGWANATPSASAPQIWSGALTFENPTGAWSGAQALPATWATPAINHQLSLSWVTVGGVTTYTLTLDGLEYGTTVGQTMVDGRAIAWLGTCDTVAGNSRAMARVRVTSSVPEYVQ